MRVSFNHCRLIATPLWPLVLAFVAASCGCSRMQYRLEADQDAYHTIAERNHDPRWFAANLDIEGDPRSRFYEVYDPDHPPMPPDDPASHQYMHQVLDTTGWEHWHDNGDRVELENPAWRTALGGYAEINPEGAVKLDVDSALKIAYVNSPLHQRQLETLYLSALDVSAERFRLDTQFFGGYGTGYTHNGSLIPPSLTYSSLLNRFIITPGFDFDGAEVNRLEVGRPSTADPALQARRRYASAGELLVGFANSFVFEFTSGDANLASSLANFAFIQPLLRGAGKDIALEDLTRDERNLLANLRAYGQFRQGFYTQVAIGELGVNGPQRGGASTSLQSFGGQGGVNGYLGLLQTRQQIRNGEDNLDLQLRTLDRLNALYDNELIDIVQVDQFRQDIERQRANLLATRNSLELNLDRYKTNTLGLPPNLEIELDESLIRQFQLIPREATQTLDRIIKLQQRVGDVAELLELGEVVGVLQADLAGLAAGDAVAVIRKLLEDIQQTTEILENRSDFVEGDLEVLEQLATERQAPSPAEQAQMDQVKQLVAQGPDALRQHFAAINARLELLQDQLSAETKAAVVADNAEWLAETLRVSQGFILIQSRARSLAGEPKVVASQVADLVAPIQLILKSTRDDLERMNQTAPVRERTMDDNTRLEFRVERKRLTRLFAELDAALNDSFKQLKALQQQLDETAPRDVSRRLVMWVAATLERVNRLALIPAQARLESITVEAIELRPSDALHAALANRLDFMNGRAALVDSWRAVQVNADALQSVLNVTGSGDIRTARNNPLSFRAPTASVRLGVEFDAPFTRLLERNAYREALIEYQRNRRSFIQSRDGLHLGLRALLRNLEQLRQNLEIQRRAVSIAMRRVDQTQLSLNPARAPVLPGQRAPINPTTAINLLGAQTSLRDSQNAFLFAWMSFYATRLRLYRELGLMQLDQDGRWIEAPLNIGELNDMSAGDSDLEELPPPLSQDLSEELSDDLSEPLPEELSEDLPLRPLNSQPENGPAAGMR